MWFAFAYSGLISFVRNVRLCASVARVGCGLGLPLARFCVSIAPFAGRVVGTHLLRGSPSVRRLVVAAWMQTLVVVFLVRPPRASRYWLIVAWQRSIGCGSGLPLRFASRMQPHYLGFPDAACVVARLSPRVGACLSVPLGRAGSLCDPVVCRLMRSALQGWASPVARCSMAVSRLPLGVGFFTPVLSVKARSYLSAYSGACLGRVLIVHTVPPNLWFVNSGCRAI